MPRLRPKTWSAKNLNVVLALVDALVASPNGKLTGEQVDAMIESAVDRKHHLTFEVGRRADWRCVENSAAEFAAGLGKLGLNVMRCGW
jgi:hypothetical protein